MDSPRTLYAVPPLSSSLQINGKDPLPDICRELKDKVVNSFSADEKEFFTDEFSLFQRLIDISGELKEFEKSTRKKEIKNILSVSSSSLPFDWIAIERRSFDKIFLSAYTTRVPSDFDHCGLCCSHAVRCEGSLSADVQGGALEGTRRGTGEDPFCSWHSSILLCLLLIARIN